MNHNLIDDLYNKSGSKIIQKYMDVHVARYKISDNIWAQQRDAFAQSIIEECIKVTLKHSKRDDDMGSIIANSIRNHFGIEE